MNHDLAPTGEHTPPARHSLGRAVAAVPHPGPLRPDTDRAGAERSGQYRLPERSDAEGVPGAWFAVVLRGYDRPQVDARLAELDRRIRDEIVRADTAEAALAAARTHVRRLQESATPSSEDRGFGLRVERVLHAAEREAAELREKASHEAAAVVEKAQADADQARRQTEEALLGRAAKLDNEFTARSATLDEREQEVDRIVERARTEAEEIRAEARHTAAEESAAAERRAADLLRQAERTIEQQRADATRDIGRMALLRDEVRQELSRLHGLLRGELDGEPVPSHPSGDHGDGSDDDANVSTAVGTIPPYTVAAIGVLPFGDRSAGGPANTRSFAFELVPDQPTAHDADDDRSDQSDEARTSDDAADEDRTSDRTPTRSTTPSRGPR